MEWQHVERRRVVCRYVVLTPVLDDWPSLVQLIGDINEKYSATDMSFEVVAVDDGSRDSLDPAVLPNLPENSCIDSISVIRLALNLGHQRAIAVGLSSLVDRTNIDGVIIIDSDGEDRPDDLDTLISMSHIHPDT